MKRDFIIRNVIIVIIVLAIVIGLLGYIIYENGRKYEIETVEQYNYFVLKQNNLFGVIDRMGNIIIEAQYDEVKIPNPQKAVFICYKNQDTKVLNANKEEILTNYEKVEPIRLKDKASDLMYEKSVLTYCEKEKYGLINFEGKKITKPIYDKIEGLSSKEGELLVSQGEKYGVINIKGKKLVNIEYVGITVDGYYKDGNSYNYAGYIVSTKTPEGYRYGYLNYKGKMILQPEYNELSRVIEIEDDENIYLIGAKNGQYGVLKNDEQIINNEYQSIEYDENNKLFIVEKSKKYGIANIEGKQIVPPEYNKIDITGVYLYAQNEQGTTVYNNNGTEANIDTNLSILNTENEKYRIRINNEDGTKYGVIGKDGQQLIEEKYNYLEYLFENYFIVSEENAKLGIINDKDEVKVEVVNDSVQRIENTDIVQTVIASDNITRLYSKNMIMVCEMKQASIEVKENYIRVFNQEENKYFTKDGKELKNTEVFENNELFSKQENGKWGFANKQGQMVLEAKYDKVTEFNEYGFASIKQNEKWGVINSKGEEIVAPTYLFDQQSEPSFIGKYYKVQYGYGEVYYTDMQL